MQLEAKFKDISLTWYMKFKAIMPVGQARSLTDLKKDLVREF
jgi:hypothetical protein